MELMSAHDVTQKWVYHKNLKMITLIGNMRFIDTNDLKVAVSNSKAGYKVGK